MISQDQKVVKEGLKSIKSILSNLQKAEDVSKILLQETNSIPLLMLTLAFPDFVSITVTIFLAMSFQSNLSNLFTAILTE